MKRIKALVCLMLAISMLLCSVPSMAEAEHGPLWIEGGEGVTLTWWIPIDSTSAQYMETYAELPFMQWMTEQTGVAVEFIHPSWEQMEQQYNLMMTSGAFYDIMFTPSSPEGPQAAVTDGLFADLNEYRDLMPNYFAAVECGDGSFSAWEWGPEKDLYYQGPQPAFSKLMTTVQGNHWAVTQVWTDRLSVELGAVIRQDWLDEANLEMPTTIAELEVVLEAFKARGEDVIPMSLGNYGYNGTTGFLASAFDIDPSWYAVIDGVVQPMMLCTEAGKEYVTLINDWYSKGYIDPDFMNRDDETLDSMFLSDRLGIKAETWNNPDYYEGNHMSASENYSVSAMPLVKMTEDQQLHFVQNYDSSATNYSVIWPGSENAEIAAQYLDKFYTKEVILRGEYGVEGESYTMVDGVPYFTEWFYENRESQNLVLMYLNPIATKYWSTRANALYWLATEDGSLPTVEFQQTYISDWYQASAVWGQDAQPDYKIGYVTFEGDGWGVFSDPHTEAETYALPMFMKMMTGVESLDNYDTVVQTALDMGYAEARNLMQEAYNKQHGQPEGFGMDAE